MKAYHRLIMAAATLSVAVSLIFYCSREPKPAFQVKVENIVIEFNDSLYSRIQASFDGKKTVLGDYNPSEFVTASGKKMPKFVIVNHAEEEIHDQIGNGKQYRITGENSILRKEVNICIYPEFPTMAFYTVTYLNKSDSAITIDNWVNNRYSIIADIYPNSTPSFWSYQSGSYESRPDWVLPLEDGFEQQNYMGMNASDYGGGTPVSDVWRKDVGLAVGHVELAPKLVSLPVSMPNKDQAFVGISQEIHRQLNPGESLTTLKTFVSVHKGDYFTTLAEYRRFMIKQGIKFDKPPVTAYEPIWCAWGYERNFTMDQIYNTLPMVKKLGYEWVVLDDGWQTAEGDWYLTKDKFPNGSQDMKKFVDKIHAEGLKAKLWFSPLAVDPGTDLIKNHPDFLLLNKDESKQDITWWDAYYLCPAYPAVQEYTKKFITKILREWDFDGLKLDGQHQNAVPPCYNPAHHHAYPEEAVEKVPEFFKLIYETALSIKPNAVVEICPCGTAYSFFTMPYMNQPVASDPTSSWQIRLKGKTFKALMGPTVPYYGDHVELSDGKDDFASTVGVGGVIGTKFTWPVGAKKDSDIDLTPEKEQYWDKWIKIYRMNMLPTGTYLGTLYDLGFDRPEAHAIQKDSTMFYAFYADHWKGDVELRGLQNKEYQVMDYVNDRYLGRVNGPIAKINVAFDKYLLILAVP